MGKEKGYTPAGHFSTSSLDATAKAGSLASQATAQADDPFSQSNGHVVPDSQGHLGLSPEAGSNRSMGLLVVVPCTWLIGVPFADQ